MNLFKVWKQLMPDVSCVLWGASVSIKFYKKGGCLFALFYVQLYSEQTGRQGDPYERCI